MESVVYSFVGSVIGSMLGVAMYYHFKSKHENSSEHVDDPEEVDEDPQETFDEQEIEEDTEVEHSEEKYQNIVQQIVRYVDDIPENYQKDIVAIYERYREKVENIISEERISIRRVIDAIALLVLVSVDDRKVRDAENKEEEDTEIEGDSADEES